MHANGSRPYQKALDVYQDLTARTSQIRDDVAALRFNVAAILSEASALQGVLHRAVEAANMSLFNARAVDHLGNLSWYVADTARRSGQRLSYIASKNLARAQARWPEVTSGYPCFDAPFSLFEQLPRQLELWFEELPDGRVRLSAPSINGPLQVGDVINSNHYDDDRYKYHDVIHAAFAACLGWSPVLRALLRRKRKSDPLIDEVEDGARARDEEEALVSYIFGLAKEADFFAHTRVIDPSMLREILRLTRAREVKARSPEHWENALRSGFHVFRELVRSRGGIVRGDQQTQTLTYAPLPQSGVLDFDSP